MDAVLMRASVTKVVGSKFTLVLFMFEDYISIVFIERWQKICLRPEQNISVTHQVSHILKVQVSRQMVKMTFKYHLLHTFKTIWLTVVNGQVVVASTYLSYLNGRPAVPGGILALTLRYLKDNIEEAHSLKCDFGSSMCLIHHFSLIV
jgi:hypothetical protein